MKEEVKEHSVLGLDPLMGKPIGELLKDIPKRCIALVSKLISYKTAILIGCGWMTAAGRLESWAFLAVVIVVLFERAGLKALKDIK